MNVKESVEYFLKERKELRLIKYLLSGGLATVTDMLLFFLLAWLIFPALGHDDFLVRLFAIPIQPIAENLRAENFIIANAIAFILSNFVAYILNALFVFPSGGRKRSQEIFLFYTLSLLVALLSIGVGTLLLNVFAATTTIAYFCKVLLSVSVNYFARQRFVFTDCPL